MSKGCTWDQVRTQVRAFKATTQVAYPNQALSTIKSFYVNGSHRLLFLSNYSTDDSESRYLLLYQVDLEAEPISASDSSFPPLDPSEYLDPYLANLATVPLAKWVPVFEDYLVPDSFSSSSSSTSSSFSPFSSPFSCCPPPPPPPFHATDSTTSSTPTTTRAALSTAAVPSSFSSSSTASVSFSSDSTTTTDTNDGNRRHAIQGISRYKVRNNKVLFSFAGDLFLGELNHASTH
ncbi:hypothetical protein BCR43DRAFT_195410 [Syncephalastrum racemosum]|uniref:Uncharacterized protein n=1 Tax=Syncephalastrum racemosum TaxID=13706 RepID=A0A1X2HHF3_SYNRA|nr:hypothetical protein BCR43DRAFT_195410 [Syncephalastrum racemosum]